MTTVIDGELDGKGVQAGQPGVMIVSCREMVIEFGSGKCMSSERSDPG